MKLPATNSETLFVRSRHVSASRGVAGEVSVNLALQNFAENVKLKSSLPKRLGDEGAVGESQLWGSLLEAP